MARNRQAGEMTAEMLVMIVGIIAMLVLCGQMIKNQLDYRHYDQAVAQEFLDDATNALVKKSLKNNGSFRGLTADDAARGNGADAAKGAIVDPDRSLSDENVWVYAISKDDSINTKVRRGNNRGIAVCQSSPTANKVACVRIVKKPGTSDDVTYAREETFDKTIAADSWEHRWE